MRAVRVRGHSHGAGPRIALLDHDLVPDPASRRIEVDTVLASKLLDLPVLLEVGLALVLHLQPIESALRAKTG